MQHMTEPELLNLVDRILGPNGILHTDGSRQFNPLQLRYARGVAQGLLRQDPHGRDRPALNFMQAGTGTGKTLGYLVPLMLLSVKTGRRAGVSTYSRALQRQVLGECEVAAACVETVTGIRPSFAYRFGRQNFACASGVARMTDALIRAGRLDDEATAFLTGLRAWLAEEGEKGQPKNSGLLVDFIAEQGMEILPAGIDESIIGLHPTDPDVDHQAYKNSVGRANDAQLVVFNHAIMIANAMLWGKMLPGVDLVVVDEADALPRAAESMISDKVSLNQASRTVAAVERRLGDDRFGKLLSDIRSKVADLHQFANHQGALLLDGGQTTALQISLKRAAAAWTPWLASDSMPDAFAKGMSGELWMDFIMTGRAFQRCLNAMIQSDGVAVLSWSPIKEFPSLHVGHMDPGHQLRKLWTPVDDVSTGLRRAAHTSICFTSATLATPGKPLPGALDGFLHEVGVIRYPKSGDDVAVHFVTEDLMDVIEPFRFGRLEFVVADPRVPDPFIKSDDDSGGQRDENWLAYAAKMIDAAGQAGGRTLVLAASYEDLAALKRVLPSASADLFGRHIFHERGQRLGDLLPAFQATEDAILLSAGAWEGLNLPGLIKQLVILRLPFPPVDTTDQVLKRLGLRQAGLAADRIDSIMAGRRQSAVRQRLAQGLGRPIRKEDDFATVWFADPRFPAPDWVCQLAHPVVFDAVTRRHHGGMVESIPQRFRSTTYPAARVFTVDGVFLKKRT